MFICVAFLLTSCTERMTKQFVVSQKSDSEIEKAGNWNIEKPQLIAFKQRAVDDIPDDSLTFWLTVRAFETKNSSSNNTLSIDSIGLKFIDLDYTVWRVPSRIVPFRKSGKNYLAFDFFRDQGVEIPNSVTSLQLFFDAIIIDTITNKQSSHEVLYKMSRFESLELMPFMIE